MQLILLAGLSQRSDDKAEHLRVCQQTASAQTGKRYVCLRSTFFNEITTVSVLKEKKIQSESCLNAYNRCADCDARGE